MRTILHIATAAEWEKAKTAGSYTADTLASEGFIHCSNSHQVTTVANTRFWGRDDLVLLCIDRNTVKAEIRDENLEGGENLFPHIYGALNIDSVVEVFSFVPQSDGSFVLPAGLAHRIT